MAESPPIPEVERDKGPYRALATNQHATDDPSSEVADFFGSLKPAISRTWVYIVLVFLIVAIIWAWYGEVDVVASAPFRIVPLGQVRTVQAPRDGEVEFIGIREGERVLEKQVLFKLRSWETWRDFRELEQARIAFQKAKYDLEEALPRKRRLTKEIVTALKERLYLAETYVATHLDLMNEYRSEVGAGDLDGLDNSDADLQARIGLRQAEIAHIKAQFERQKALFEESLISRVDMERARVEYINALARLPSQMSDTYMQEIAIHDIKRKILEAQLSLDRESTNAKYTYESSSLNLKQAQQKVARALDAESDLIVAPEAGVVTRVMVNTKGQVIRKGQSLALIAPETAPMVAELMILNKDVGLMKAGQTVKLKYDAFAFQDYGIKRGWLTDIAPDATTDDKLGLVFRGIVELEETMIWVKGDEKPLMFGMKGVGEVVTDRQSVLKLLLSPIRKLYESAKFTNIREE